MCFDKTFDPGPAQTHAKSIFPGCTSRTGVFLVRADYSLSEEKAYEFHRFPKSGIATARETPNIFSVDYGLRRPYDYPGFWTAAQLGR